MADLDTVTVAELRAALESGVTTSRAIVEAHLERITRLDPAFGSVRCVAADALDQADTSDRIRRESGARGQLEGIPVLVKDNIDVAGLPTTGGALALEHAMPARDAPLVARLRESGAVVLGKTNLSELANFLTENMPSGYSSLGGQVLNPYDTSVTPSGSSSGSAVAAALGLAPLTIGTETDGSITSPSEFQSLVGMKPTLGLVSRTGILPIAASQDTAGPMTRTVADAAALLAAIAGPDPADPATAGAGSVVERLRALALDPGALAGVRLAVVRGDADDESDKRTQEQLAGHERALAALRDAGAELVDVTLPKAVHDDETAVLHYEFAPGVDAYLAAMGDGAPVRSLAELQAWNREHADAALKFGQVHVDKAVAIDHDREREAYLRTRERDLRAATGGMLAALGDDLECLVFPGADGCGWAARAGWPSIVLPAGYTADNRRPVGIMLVGRAWTDARLLSLAYAAERFLPARRTPAEVNPAVFRRLS
ncbi:MAG TPA: amidase family protein [Micromonosporaceae bacterium]|nr:amidase family protein [Micromonosporaceae bacterium]